MAGGISGSDMEEVREETGDLVKAVELLKDSPWVNERLLVGLRYSAGIMETAPVGSPLYVNSKFYLYHLIEESSRLEALNTKYSLPEIVDFDQAVRDYEAREASK